jgi:hypothetical protein
MSRRSRYKQPTKTKPAGNQLAQDLERVELWDAYVRLGCRIALLLIAVALAVVTVICMLRGSHWPVPASTSVSSTIAGIASLFDRHLN